MYVAFCHNIPREPMDLKCGHVVCLDCSIVYTRSYPCPVCNESRMLQGERICTVLQRQIETSTIRCPSQSLFACVAPSSRVLENFKKKQ